MEQMQANMLYMLQAVSAMRPEAPGASKNTQAEDSDFRGLLEKAKENAAEPEAKEAEKAEKAEAGRDAEQPEQPEKPQKSGDETEETVLQELAAMQSLYMQAGRPPVAAQPAEAEAGQPVMAEQPAAAAAAPEQAAVVAEEAPVMSQVKNGPADTQVQAPEAQPAEQPAQTAEMAVERPQAENQPENRQQGSDNADKAMTPAVRTRSDDTVEQPEAVERPVFENVETAPIKVSETTEAQAAPKPESVEAQVEETVTKALEQGETRVELQLAPENLGKVTVELTHREDGTIHVALHAENSQTRGLLEKDLAGLQQLLSRNSQQEVQVEVPRPPEDQRQDLKDGHQQQNQRQQQQEQRQSRESGEDFLSRLRLGLIPLEETAS